MPWSVADVDRHRKGLGPAQKRRWVTAANAALRACLRKGGTDATCAPSAIRIANSLFESDGRRRFLLSMPETGLIYYGQSPETVQHNVDVLINRGYDEDVAQDIAKQIAGKVPPAPEQPPEASASSSVAAVATDDDSNPAGQTA
jgi:hypothetical protein